MDVYGGGTRRALRQHRRLALLLLVAFLPSVTFLGHINVHIEVPGTGLYVGLPAPATHEHGAHAGHHDDRAEHERHCHADFASCSDVPFTGASAFLLLEEAARMLGLAGLMVLVFAAARRPGTSAGIAPLLPPPRFAAL